MENPHSILKKVFGYDSFRLGQEEIVNRLLAGQDVLAVMPTGAGKSICYQVPALLLPGITLVVSPLVSLMKDQVGALVQAGVAAAFLNNSLNDNQKALMLHRAREGWYKIIYVAPERLEMPGFQRFAQERQISMVTVDERPTASASGDRTSGPATCASKPLWTACPAARWWVHSRPRPPPMCGTTSGNSWPCTSPTR